VVDADLMVARSPRHAGDGDQSSVTDAYQVTSD
jgi:hypothetical protein